VSGSGQQWPLGRLPGASPLAAAGNGSDIAVVWRDTSLRLVILHADGTMSAPMTLSADGYGAKIVAGGAGRLVVLYRGGGDLLTARILDSPPARSRAVR